MIQPLLSSTASLWLQAKFHPNNHLQLAHNSANGE